MIRWKIVAALACLLFGTTAKASENIFLISDTMTYLERAFGVRAKATAWFVQEEGSTLNFSFAGKGDVNFHLTQKNSEDRFIDQIQIEPAAGGFSISEANAYAKHLENSMKREGWNCILSRNDQDGINGFIIYSCADKAVASGPTMNLSVTIQSVGGRNLVFVRFAPKKRR